MSAGEGTAMRLRCEPHSLACDARGHCVLCRRELGLASEPPPSARPSAAPRGASAGAILGLLLFLVVAVAVAVWLVPASEGRDAPATVAATVEPDEGQDLESIRAERAARAARKAEQARTQRMLREAEAQRRALEARGKEGVIPTDPAALSEGTSRPSGASMRASERALERRADELRREREREQKQRAMERARERVQITLYSAKWCGVCTRARNYMQQKGIAFTERDVDEDPAADAAFRRLNPKRTLPTIDIDGNVVTGFSKSHFERAREHAVRQRVR